MSPFVRELVHTLGVLDHMSHVVLAASFDIFADVNGPLLAWQALVREVRPPACIDDLLDTREAIVEVLRQMAVLCLKVVLVLDEVEVGVPVMQSRLLDPGEEEGDICLHADLQVDIDRLDLI